MFRPFVSFLSLVFVYLAVFSSLVGCQSENIVTVGYQGMANPWKLLIANGSLDKIAESTHGKKIEWKKFNSGAKVINAMASGDIDLAVVGSTPLASALGRKLDLKLIWIMEVIGQSEALVGKGDINTLQDLKGKKVAVPFGSTTHYHLLLALQKNGISPTDVEILNLSPSAIVSSWKKDEISAAFVWAPALEEIKQTGKVLISSEDLANQGHPTFDGFVVRSKFLNEDPKNKMLVTKLLSAINNLYGRMPSSDWGANSLEVQQIAKFVGAKPSDVVTSLKGYQFPGSQEQLGPSLFGGGLDKALKETSLFLKEQGKISDVLDSYETYISSEFLKNL